jgi:hypothetical protein
MRSISCLEHRVEARNVFGNSKKIIVHYHGTDVRGIKNQKESHRSKMRTPDIAVRGIRRIKDAALFKKRIHLKAQESPDAVVVSTPDLLSIVPKVVHVPNPIDTEHFARKQRTANFLKRVKLYSRLRECQNVRVVSQQVISILSH